MSTLHDWEGEVPSSIPLPGTTPNVYLSKKCANSPEGLGLTRALVDAARDEWLNSPEYEVEAQDAFEAQQEAFDQWLTLP